MGNLAKIYLGGKYPPSLNKLNHYERLFANNLMGSTKKTVDWTPVISVSDALAKPVVDYQCKITAVQSGTNPSPQNICQIDGWVGANISVNGSTVAVSWQSEAGTVYGGVLDVTMGTLTAIHTISIIDENMDGGVANIGGLWFVNNFALVEYGEGLLISDSFVYTGRSYANTTEFKANTVIGDMGGCSISGNRYRVFFRDDRFANNDELKAYLAEHPVQVVQALAEPIIYNLTPTQIELSEGANTLWSDTGDSKLTYLARAAENVRKMNATLAKNNAILKAGGKVTTEKPVLEPIEKPIIKKE